MQRNGRLDGRNKLRCGLFWQAIDKVEVDFCTAFAQNFHDVGHRKQARSPVHRAQHVGVKILNAEAKAVKSAVQQVLPIVGFEIAGVAFNGNFGLVDG